MTVALLTCTLLVAMSRVTIRVPPLIVSITWDFFRAVVTISPKAACWRQPARVCSSCISACVRLAKAALCGANAVTSGTAVPSKLVPVPEALIMAEKLLRFGCE